jgi:hypothetical protein
MSGENATAEYLPPSGFFIGIILFICLCIIVGIIGNVGVIAYNIFMNHSKTPATYFVVNLAISDIIVCLTFFPPWLVEFISILIDTERDRVFICKIGMTSSLTSIALSIANLLAITIDKFVFISKPLKYTSIMTWKRTYILLLVIWLLTMVNTTLIFFSTEEVIGWSVSCQVRNPARYIFAFINLYIPVLCIFYFNYKMYKVAKKQRTKIRHESCATSYANQYTTGTSENTEIKKRLKQLKMVKTFAIAYRPWCTAVLYASIVDNINYKQKYM